MAKILPEASTVVTVYGSAYRVLFPREGLIHYVDKGKVCSCGQRDCPAVPAVAVYLRNGGKRAPDLLKNCPICGAKIELDQVWDGKYTHQPGWRCQKGGLRHFLEAKANRIQRQLAQNPWIIPPVIQNGVCVYPGVRREEMMSWQECADLQQQVFEQTGYDPGV